MSSDNRSAVLAAVRKHGVSPVARAMGVARESTLAYLAGVSRESTAALVEARVHRLASLPAVGDPRIGRRPAA
jgi:hypothetical protein